MTVAGSVDRKSGVTMTGVAAHITAASRKGPRYDSDMSSEERSSETNGIWLCQIHGKLIDDNPSRCTVVELRRWKAQHEKWIFDRVESGTELFNSGVCRLGFGNVGVFCNDFRVSLGRNNVLVGDNETGKTSFCEILSAFSGGDHWKQFNHRFEFSKGAASRTYIEMAHSSGDTSKIVRLSPQFTATGRRLVSNSRQWVYIEVDGCPSFDWPRSMPSVLYFESQLYRTHHSDPKDNFVKAIRYLASVLGTAEDLIWDSLREELFVNSTFGYRFRRTGYRKVEVLVPDGRAFYLPHVVLGFTEQQMAFLEIALKCIKSSSNKKGWFLIFDTAFFQRFDQARKSNVFKKIIEFGGGEMQTLFCLNSTEDAEVLKSVQSDKWINAEHFGGLTLHSFL